MLPLKEIAFHMCVYGICVKIFLLINTLRPRQNGRHFADNIFKCIFLNENVWIPIKISLKLVPKGPINNIPALFQIMAWRRPGIKPLSEPMMVSLLTYICVTRPQWVKGIFLCVKQFKKVVNWNITIFRNCTGSKKIFKMSLLWITLYYFFIIIHQLPSYH